MADSINVGASRFLLNNFDENYHAILRLFSLNSAG